MLLGLKNGYCAFLWSDCKQGSGIVRQKVKTYTRRPKVDLFAGSEISKKGQAEPDPFLRRGEACFARKTPPKAADAQSASSLRAPTRNPVLPPFLPKSIGLCPYFLGNFNRPKVGVYFWALNKKNDKSIANAGKFLSAPDKKGTKSKKYHKNNHLLILLRRFMLESDSL
jgi:hypothetical protein